MKTWKRSLLPVTAVTLPVCLTLLIIFLINIFPAYSADDQILKPRVPADRLAEAKGLKNMIPSNMKTLSEARDIFLGKGVCSNCHGKGGRGDGPAGVSFNPPPRDFTDGEWQATRSDGEIFWAISRGTEYGMIGFEDILSSEERWMLVNYIRELGKPKGIASKE